MFARQQYWTMQGDGEERVQASGQPAMEQGLMPMRARVSTRISAELVQLAERMSLMAEPMNQIH